MAQRIIRIAAQKPTVVFGVPHPSDTINRWLERHYVNGHFSTAAVVTGTVPIFFGAFCMWFYSAKMTGKLPKTLSKEWKEANAVYVQDQASDVNIFKNWKPGKPVIIPKKPTWTVD